MPLMTSLCSTTCHLWRHVSERLVTAHGSQPEKKQLWLLMEANRRKRMSLDHINVKHNKECKTKNVPLNWQREQRWDYQLPLAQGLEKERAEIGPNATNVTNVCNSLSYSTRESNYGCSWKLTGESACRCMKSGLIGSRCMKSGLIGSYDSYDLREIIWIIWIISK